MTSIDHPDHQRYQPRTNAMPSRASRLGYGSRAMLLAVGGYFIVRIALALLHIA